MWSKCLQTMIYVTVLLLVIFGVLIQVFLCKANPLPNVIFILADDLGFNDVGFHGSGQIPTPNIDALAYSGLILNNYYVTPICTPSRSALMTGKFPVHTGMQHSVLYGMEPRGLPLSEKLLPEYLNDLGYESHIVGKWHLGSYKKEYTPLFRGFKSHIGPWTGHHDYNDHTAMETNTWGLDMRRNMDVAWDLHGQYSTDVFTKEATNIIAKHDEKNPLFLYVAHVATHSGNPYNPLPVPDAIAAKYDNITDYNRRRFAGMLDKLDESVGKIVEALKTKNMLKDSIIVFSADNGGPAAGFNLNAASNYPLKGTKNTLWEGGVRGAGLIWSPLIKKSKRVSKQMVHISDWLPTLYSAIGGNSSVFEKIDGVDVWNALSEDGDSPRTGVLHNIDDIYGNAALTVDNWKLLKGSTYNGQWDDWYGPSGRDYPYDYRLVENSYSGKSLKSIGMLPSENDMKRLREKATVVCPEIEEIPCHPLVSSCLFNIKNDPCEKQNLANQHPDILDSLEKLLQKINATVVPPGNLPLDERGNPKYWDYTFTNFGDYELPLNYMDCITRQAATIKISVT